jgi:AraC family transcriptional regulator
MEMGAGGTRGVGEAGRRILARRQGVLEPMFGPRLDHALSPSPTLPVETHAVPAGAAASQCLPGQVVTMFLQPCAALHAVGEGATARLRLPARSVAISLREQQEHMRWTSAARFISIGLDDTVVARAAAQLARGGRLELTPAPAVRDERLSALLYALYLEQAAGFPGGRLLVDGLEQALAAVFATRFNAYGPAPATAADALSPHAARRVIELMHASLDQPLSLATLAHCAGYSEAHFSRLFRARFGEPPHRYLLRLRMEHAKLLLRRDGPPIVDVALACGFANAQHFSRSFMRLAGCSPSDFRRAA